MSVKISHVRSVSNQPFPRSNASSIYIYSIMNQCVCLRAPSIRN
jgi:hypothetical protein